MNFSTTPIPHHEAVRLIADKPAVARDVFDALPDEMRGRAFTITGIEDFDVLQSVRDQLAALPAGADWNATKKAIMAQISPWFTPEGAAARAQLLMSHHAFAAYSACQARIMDRMVDVFPYRQYLSTKDGKVRASHAALNEIILPADHEFWTYHTPPWEWNCRCQVVELTAEDRDEERSRDEKRAPENRRVLEGPALAQLGTGQLTRGINIQVDTRTPKERGGAYQWSARDATLPYQEIRARWSDSIATAFESWAAVVDIDGTSLLEHLSGQPVTPAPATVMLPRPATFAEALRRLGMDTKDKWTRKDIADLRSSLRVASPALEADHVAAVHGARLTGALTEKEIRRTVQDLLAILPRTMADTLPPVDISLIDTSLGHRTGGCYDPVTKKIRVTTFNMTGLRGERRRRELRRILSHELMHWAHMSSTGPAADAYRAAIRDHYAIRTAGERLINDCRRDRWWDRYAGKEYPFEHGRPLGIEVPTRYYELWETPDILSLQTHLSQTNFASETRETFALVHTFFDIP